MKLCKLKLKMMICFTDEKKFENFLKNFYKFKKIFLNLQRYIINEQNQSGRSRVIRSLLCSKRKGSCPDVVLMLVWLNNGIINETRCRDDYASFVFMSSLLAQIE